ncbi:MAG: hypothetical protein US31_C0004G0025 [Berkelbacteria bacterium GW2011_GWA1_36_9]|uniref:Uncharacterized protein n=1 Tax=Berkelbacteria bacterium GW2011_GWA1_36_9 TaxID=1618331 RepID=A0A0G0FHD6_9BACT|nr:MAG: hypothetical protein US31_C0004G0025 [Berkelbacteria bacterium GW2011_GWA1_36_9]
MKKTILTGKADKVLLIQPNYQIRKDAKLWACSPSLGLLYLAAVLEKEKIPVEIIDANLHNITPRAMANLIKKRDAKYAGFSILTPAVNWSINVIKYLPKSIIKIAGGPHASSLPNELLKYGFDIAVIGEGEETLLEIAKGKALNQISGIAYRTNKKIFQTQERPPLNPSKLPLPARHLIEKGGTNKPYFAVQTRFFPWAQIVTSRGCPFNCYFCTKDVFGYHFRPRSPENVLSEIDFLVNKYRIKEINIYDDCFNFDIKRAEKIMELIAKRGYKLYIRFNNGIRADKVTPTLLKKMKKAGTDFIAFGVESGNQEILNSIPKGESLLDIRRAVKLTNKVGIPITGFFILGLIGDTKKTMQDTIDFATSLPFDRAIFTIAVPNPGTRMLQIIQQRGGKIFTTDWQNFHSLSGKMQYSLPGMATPEEVEKMYRKAYISFYFRPLYLIKHIPNFFSWSLLPIISRGLIKIFYTQKT